MTAAFFAGGSFLVFLFLPVGDGNDIDHGLRGTPPSLEFG